MTLKVYFVKSISTDYLSPAEVNDKGCTDEFLRRAL